MVRSIYRDRPIGEAAEFVCENCLPVEMKPRREDKNEVLDIHRALNRRQS